MSTESKAGHTSSEQLRIVNRRLQEQLEEQTEELERRREEESQRNMRDMIVGIFKTEMQPLVDRLARLEDRTSGDFPPILPATLLGTVDVAGQGPISKQLQAPPMPWYERPAVHRGAATAGGGGGVVAIIWAIVELLSH